MRKVTGTPLDARQFLAFVVNRLGVGTVQRILRPHGEPIDERTLYRWTSDPRHASSPESIRKNPIERVKALLEEAMLFGHRIEAQALVAWLADAVDADVDPRETSVPDHEDVRDEILDDYPAMVAFHEQVRLLGAGKTDPENVLEFERRAIEEIKQTKHAAFMARGKTCVVEMAEKGRERDRRSVKQQRKDR